MTNINGKSSRFLKNFLLFHCFVDKVSAFCAVYSGVGIALYIAAAGKIYCVAAGSYSGCLYNKV